MTVIDPVGSPLGFFVPSPGVGKPQSALIADLIDPVTHEYLDILTGDDPIDAQVKIALKVFRNSGAAVEEVGQTFLLIDKLGDDVVTLIRGDVYRALDFLIRNGDIRLHSISEDEQDVMIEVDESSQTAELVVRYKNLRSPDPRVRMVRRRMPEHV